MPRLHEPRPVYLYNRFPLKPWYLSGQVEVCGLMSALRPQMGLRATDRRLCPVSDWELGLVTGIQFYRLAAPRSHAHTPALARWEAGMEGLIGCLDGSVGCLQWQRTHKDLEDHTHTHTHPQELILHGVPWAVTFLLRWQPLPWPLYPRALVILPFLIFFDQAQGGQMRSVWLEVSRTCFFFLQDVLIRGMLPTWQSVADRQLGTRNPGVMVSQATQIGPSWVHFAPTNTLWLSTARWQPELSETPL